MLSWYLVVPASLCSQVGVWGMAECFSEPESQVFVLRCWREADSGDQPWRLQVEHVPSGKRTPLADLALLRPLLEEYLLGTVLPERPESQGT